jgi:ankyrin repeat protein
VDCIKFCIEMGANISGHDIDGNTALHNASWNGHVNVVRVLLDAGVIVDVANSIGWTPLCCAIRFKHVDVGHTLIDRGARVSIVNLIQ